MAWPDGAVEPTTVATVVTAVLIGIGGAWRLVLKARRELRADREGEVVSDSYAGIIRRLQEREVAQGNEIMALREQYARDYDSMRKDIHDLRDELQTARVKRDEAVTRALSAETEVLRLKARIGTLEDQVHALQAAGK